MNENATEKKTILTKVEFVKYETTFDLFKIVYNLCKMVNSGKHFDYCYCNEKKSKCWLCKFGQYIKYNHLENDLLLYREDECKLLNISDKIWFYIRKVKKDVKELTSNYALEFFHQKFDCSNFDDIIKDDISKFKVKYLK